MSVTICIIVRIRKKWLLGVNYFISLQLI